MKSGEEQQAREVLELRRKASQIMMVCGLVESVGWAMLVVSFVGAPSMALRIVLFVLGLLFAGAGLLGVIWIAVKMAQLPRA